jgi:hypothetical protein
MHIYGRTRGREPDGRKNTVDEYVEACAALVASMSASGFDPTCPIVLCSTPRLKNGAHRLACAMAMGLGPWRTLSPKPGQSPPWGRAELCDCGIRESDIRRAEKDLMDACAHYSE